MKEKPGKQQAETKGKAAKTLALWLVVAVCAGVIVWAGLRWYQDRQALSGGSEYYQELKSTPETRAPLAGAVLELSSEEPEGKVPVDLSQAAHALEDVPMRERFALMDEESEYTQEQRALLEEEAREREKDAEHALEEYGQLRGVARPAEKDEKRASSMDFTQLKSENEDLVGWIRLEDTVIDYPLVQGEDNAYYLSHLYNGVENKAGTIFADYRNERDFQDTNTLIYGHHLKSGAMFASLVGYKNQEYYDLHPRMELYTEQGDYLVEFFSGYVVPIRDEALPCFYMNYGSEEEYLAYIAEAKRRSTFKSDVEVGAEDRIVTLVTCTYEVYDARYILQGKITPVHQAQ